MSTDNSDSEKRTRWSEDRTLMSNERTFNSWLGTGLGCVGVAIGMKAVFGAFEPTWAAKGAASIFLLIAILLFWSARNQACATRQRLDDKDAKIRSGNSFTLVAALMILGTLATGGILWSL